MTYDQLIAFLAVADAGTFGAASQRLHKSQPAVSKLVSNLEAELELKLFDRTTYRPVLTEAGVRFRARAELAVADMLGLRDYARTLARGFDSTVRLVVESVTPLGRVTSALKAVRARFPHVRMELCTETLASTLDRLFGGEADLAIGQHVGALASDLEALPFLEVPIVPVAHRSHPLAQLSGPISARSLFEHVQVVLRESAPSTSSYSLNVMHAAPHWYVTDVPAKLEVIRSGLGWGGLPKPVVKEELRRGTLVQLDLPDFTVRSMPLSLLRRRSRGRGPVVDALWAALSGAASHRLRRAQRHGH